MESNENIECGLCGRNGGAVPGCSIGCNGDERFNQPRNYTLSEERSGRAPVTPRYGPEGQAGPKTEDPLWFKA